MNSLLFDAQKTPSADKNFEEKTGRILLMIDNEDVISFIPGEPAEELMVDKEDVISSICLPTFCSIHLKNILPK